MRHNNHLLAAFATQAQQAAAKLAIAFVHTDYDPANQDGGPFICYYRLPTDLEFTQAPAGYTIGDAIENLSNCLWQAYIDKQVLFLN